eukprot:m.63027 g.63027  ORF g.63027 m.63027 type:complete len:660 (+) comp11938_c0_seq1:228-2207(+)
MARLAGSLALVAFVATVTYLNGLNGDFVFDDMPAIVDNNDVFADKSDLAQLWSNNFWGQEMGASWSQHHSYRPLTTMTFRWTISMFGLDKFWLHLGNVALHTIASVLMTLVFRACLPSFTPLVHTFAGLVFAVHPVHAESVSNIVCRAEMLAGIFWALAFLTYAWGVTSIDQRPASKSSSHTQSSTSPALSTMQFLPVCGLTLLFAVAALLSKEQGIMVLPACILWDILVNCKVELSSFVPFTPSQNSRHQALKPSSGAEKATSTAKAKPKPSVRSTNALWLRIAVMVVVTAMVYQMRVALNKGDDAKMDEKTNPANHIEDTLNRVLTKNHYAFIHFGLLVWPFSLCCDWSSFGVPNVEGLSDFRNLETAAMYLFLAWVCFASVFAKDLPQALRSSLLLGIGWAIVTFIPASGLLVEVGFVVAERILYMPVAGYCIALAAFLGHMGSFYSSQKGEVKLNVKSKKQLGGSNGDERAGKSVSGSDSESQDNGVGVCRDTRWLCVSAGVLILLVFTGRTVLRNADWQSELSLYETGLKVLPNNAKLNHNFAHSTSDIALKEVHYRAAIRIYPPYASAYINLGVVLAQSNRLSEAVSVWKKGLEQWNKRPIIGNDPAILNLNIGTGLKNMGRPREALPYLERCTQISQMPSCKQRLQEARSML